MRIAHRPDTIEINGIEYPKLAVIDVPADAWIVPCMDGEMTAIFSNDKLTFHGVLPIRFRDAEEVLLKN